MTRLSTGGVEGDAFDVRLTSGPVVTAAVVDTTEAGLVVVTIVEADDHGHAVAGALPGDDEMVTILADPPITIAFGDIATVGVDEGTPVLDADGDLVGSVHSLRRRRDRRGRRHRSEPDGHRRQRPTHVVADHERPATGQRLERRRHHRRPMTTPTIVATAAIATMPPSAIS